MFKPSVQARATVRKKAKGSKACTSLKAALEADLTMEQGPAQASAKEAEVLAWPRRQSWRTLSGPTIGPLSQLSMKSQLEKAER